MKKLLVLILCLFVLPVYAHRSDRSPQVANSVVAGAGDVGNPGGNFDVPDNTTLINADATAGDMTVTLPDAATVPNVSYTVIKTDVTTNTVTIIATGGDTIAGSSQYVLLKQYDTLRANSDGSNYVAVVPMDTKTDGRLFGMIGDNITDDRAALALAISQATPGELHLTEGIYRIASDITIDAAMTMDIGAQLSPDVGVTITIDANMDLPLTTVFVGNGDVTFTQDSVDFVVPIWWGTDRAAFVKGVDAAVLVEQIEIPPGLYDMVTSIDFLDTLVNMPSGAVLSVGAGQTITIANGFTATPDDHFDGDGEIDFDADAVDAVLPQWWGSGIQAYDHAIIGANKVENIDILPGTYNITTNIDFLESVVNMPSGAILDIDPGIVVTINKNLNASTTDHFDGTGTVTFGADGVDFVVPQWWGATADGVTDDAAAFNAAAGAGGGVEQIQIPPGFYSIATNVDLLDKMMNMAPGAILDIDNGVTVTIGSGTVVAGLEQHFQGLGTVVFSEDAVEHILPQWWGAVGDGVTDDSPAFIAAIAAAAGREILVVGTDASYKLSENVTVGGGVRIRFQQGSLLSIDNTKIFAVNGLLEAGQHQIFSGAGTVTFAIGSCKELLPQWWGAVGDGVADDTAEVQAALTAAELTVRKVFMPAGSYLTSSPLSIRYGTKFIGAGREITEIIVSGGNGINITIVVDGEPYESAIVRGMRLYSTATPVEGIGISVIGVRDALIEDVWIGGWYSGNENTDKYGFEKGIELKTAACYYTTVRRCMLFRNTYGVYLGNTANSCRILDNVLWYNDYGIYCTSGVGGVVIANNAIEGSVTRGIYTEATESLIIDNRIESHGVQPIELGPSAKRSRIVGTYAVTGLGDDNSVLNNSDTPDGHRLNDSQLVIGDHNVGNFSFPAGVIKSNIYNNWQTEMVIEAVRDDLLIRAAREDNISVQSSLGVDRGTFNTPIFGTGDYANNIQKYSQDFSNWLSSGNLVTRENNAAVAPDGTITAGRIVSSDSSAYLYYAEASPDFVQGDLLQVSVWLRTDTAHNCRIYLRFGGTTVIFKDVWVDKYWRRYVMNYTADTSPGNTQVWIRPYANIATFVWGAQIAKGTPVTGTDDSGVNNKASKLVDTGTNFRTSGIDIGGELEVIAASTATKGNITGINTILNFNTGNGTEPSVGDTVTGGTSGATGTIAVVTISGGSFGGGDAAGTMEVVPVGRTFEAEALSWSGSSATVASVNLDCVLVVDDLLPTYGAKADADNGDTYYAWSSIQRSPKPYIPTTVATVSSNPIVALKDTEIRGDMNVTGTMAATTVTGANVTSGADVGHTHTGASLSGIDISDDTNLAVTAPITLTDDTVGITIAKDLVAGGGLTGGEDDVFPKADADVTVAVGGGDGVIVNTDEIEVFGLVASDGDPNDAFFLDGAGIPTAKYGMVINGELSGDPLNDQFSEMLIGDILSQATTPPGLWVLGLTPATTEPDQGAPPASAHDATYNNFTTSDQVAKSLAWTLNFFDGGDEYLTVADDPAFSWPETGKPFSMCAWIEVIDTVAAQLILSKFNVQTTDREWYFYISSSEKLQARFYDEANNIEVGNFSDDAPSAGWHFVVHTYDSTGGAGAMSDANTVWYVDGVAIAQSQTNDGAYVNMVAGDTDVLVGAYNFGAGVSTFFRGDMGAIWLEDVELTALQVWLYYKMLKGYYNE